MKAIAPLLGLILLFVSPASPQKAPRKSTPASAYKLIAVKVTGTRYSDNDILAASGLQLGQSVGEADVKAAIRRLGDSGLFTDIAYSYSYSPEGTKVEFQLTDAPQKNAVPVHFENLVWFTDAELIAEIERSIPLFKQTVPIAGGYPDKISAALQALLEEKHLPGRVDYLRQSNQYGGDIIGIAYRVMDIDIRIRSLEFPGASPEQVDLLKAASRRYVGADYDRDALASIARLDLLPVYLQRGYLKAAFLQSEARVEPSSSDGDIQVDAILPVAPGKVYSTSAVAWRGNAAIATDKLEALIHLPPAQPADAVRLQHDLEEVGKLYRDQGYMMAHISPVTALDDEKGTVHYDLDIVEGDQFKMGELDFLGLDPQMTARMQEAWTLAEGQPYNASYPKKFLETSLRTLPAGSHWNASVQQAVNEKDKTVDVTIKFTPR